jgi:hypothetical protein
MRDSRRPTRRRWALAVAVLLVVFTGLASRSFPFLFPSSWGKYPGDALWATMVLFGITFLRPSAAPIKLALVALLVSYAVEFSQIYQGAWAKAVRSTRIGHLVFGSGFDWVDLAAYTIGVAVGFILDLGLFSRMRHAEKAEPEH